MHICRDCDALRYLERRETKQAKDQAKPKDRLKLRNKHYLRSYGVSRDQVLLQLDRQRHRCLGCQEHITEDTLRVDHDHKKPGTMRGLLCGSCNIALGNVRDNQGTLYRLASYMAYDWARPQVYIIGSLRNPNIPAVGKEVRALGMEAFDNWHAAGPHADDSWQAYETNRGHSYEEALHGRTAKHAFNFDRANLDLSDAAIMVMPAGKSGHLELGYMAGRGKPTYILTEAQPDRFDLMPNFATMVTNDLASVLRDLQERLGMYNEVDGF